MNFTFITLFPKAIKAYFKESILKRASENKLIQIEYINPREYTKNKYQKVDEYIVGGGAGLLMFAQPLYDAIGHIKKQNKDIYVIYATPSGKKFSQKDAKRLAKKKHIVFLCGRYEGIDERIVEECCDEVFCIGDFIVTGGELPSLMMCDAISRNIDGVLGNASSLDEESFEEGLLEAPAFTKPNIFKNISVPLEFLKGNHAKIASFKKLMSLSKTKFFRPDLYNAKKYEDKKDKK